MFSYAQKLAPFSKIAFKALQIGSGVLSAACLFSSAALAQLGASPLVIEAEANQGQAQAIINVINSGDTPLRTRIYTEPFTYERDKGFQTVSSSSNNLSPYLQFSPTELTVPPGATRRVRLRAILAPSLPDGEYRTAVFAEALKESTDASGRRVGVITRVATTVYVRKGDVDPKLTVDSATFNSEQKTLQLLVHNTGDASVRLGVNWKLKQGETVVRTGESIPTAIVAQGDRNLLLNNPQSDPSPLPPGNYQLTGELTWGENNSNKLPFTVNLTIPTR
ncbi:MULTISPECIES: P pilus assembly protein, chaperone PapD [unclassified Coleofasciculus]|uniref:P pilus assembly protein, chaperone PapD n=1 Tax=unclassified Coleofasciculus TaxID=2692782 RepID=UPI001D1440A0|nr:MULTISPECIES: P pilus assembly protein, chaperone PapD [unclassified Coleofasciculus]